MYAQSFNCVQLFVTPWTIACQAPLSMEFSRQEFWSGMPFPTPGDLPDPGIEPMSLASLALAGRFPGGRDGNPFQYSCLENSMDRGAWWASVQGGHNESDMTDCMHTHTHTRTHTRIHIQSCSNLETGLILPTISKWNLLVSTMLFPNIH